MTVARRFIAGVRDHMGPASRRDACSLDISRSVFLTCKCLASIIRPKGPVPRRGRKA
jgi:hypothetical protein